MTTLASEPDGVAQAEAPRVPLARALAVAVSAVFVAIGWVPGAAVRGIIFIGLALRYGWFRGLGLADDDIRARAVARVKARQEAAAARMPAPDPRA
jgi:hypothetical protein